MKRLFRKNPMKALDKVHLKESEGKLRMKTGELSAEIRLVESEIEFLFEKGKDARSHSEEVSLAHRIKTATQKREMKAAAQINIEKDLAAISNLLIIIEHEDDLKVAGVWEPLGKLPPEKLQEYLTELQLGNEERGSQVEQIVDLTSSMFLKAPDEMEEGIEDILDVMSALKEGKLEPDTAREKVTREQERDVD